MNIRHPEIFEHSIVLGGDFNVLIFQPLWFSAEGLIRENEARNAEVDILHRDIALFSLGWLQFRAEPNRVVFLTKHSSYLEPLRDLVIGTFNALSRRPIRGLGLNYNTHTQMPSDWNWEEFQKTLRGDGVLKAFDSGIVRSVSIENNRTYNDLEGTHNITIEPSPSIDRGVFVNSNDNYILRQDDPAGSDTAVKIVEEQWENAYNESEKYRKLVVDCHD